MRKEEGAVIGRAVPLQHHGGREPAQDRGDRARFQPAEGEALRGLRHLQNLLRADHLAGGIKQRDADRDHASRLFGLVRGGGSGLGEGEGEAVALPRLANAEPRRARIGIPALELCKIAV